MLTQSPSLLHTHTHDVCYRAYSLLNPASSLTSIDDVRRALTRAYAANRVSSRSTIPLAPSCLPRRLDTESPGRDALRPRDRRPDAPENDLRRGRRVVEARLDAFARPNAVT